jgi:ribonuclease P protein subunit RPR2
VRRDKVKERKIARERIRILMDLAEKESLNGRMERTDRYVALAKKIGMRYNVRFPRELSRKVCKHCDSFLLPSVNCRVRLTGRTVSIYCFKCKEYTRIPYLKEKKGNMEKMEKKVKKEKKEKKKKMGEKGKRGKRPYHKS